MGILGCNQSGRVAVAVLLLAAVAPPVLAQKSASNLQFNLATFLTSQGLAASDVKFVGAIRLADGEKWQRGAVPGARFSNLGLLQTNGSGESAASRAFGLTLTYSGLEVEPVKLNACSSYAAGGCSDLALQKLNAASRQAEVGSVMLRLDTPGSPCESGMVCQIRLPSWALFAGLRDSDGSIEALPSTLLLVDTSAGIAFFDAARRSQWLSWSRRADSMLAGFGPVQSLRDFGGGRIGLQFGGGAKMLVDFPGDRAIVLRPEGRIELVSKPLAALASGSLIELTDLGDPANSESRKLVDWSPEVVMWSDKSVDLNLGDSVSVGGAFASPAAVSAIGRRVHFGGVAISSYALVDGKIRTYTLSPGSQSAKGSWESRGDSAPAGLSSAPKFVQFAGRVVAYSPTSLVWANTDGETGALPQLQDGAEIVDVDGSGALFVRVNRGDVCTEVMHELVLNAGLVESRSTGVNVPCAVRSWITSGPNSMSRAELSGAGGNVVRLDMADLGN